MNPGRSSSTAASALALHGMPFSVKEDIDCLGSATTHGLPSLRDPLPYDDAPAVARLKAAEAIPIARTILSELGMRLCSANSLRGRTLNPYDRRLIAGGSSCGDAAAVATGMVPLGLGGDIGGSLRIPAECCAWPRSNPARAASPSPPPWLRATRAWRRRPCSRSARSSGTSPICPRRSPCSPGAISAIIEAGRGPILPIDPALPIEARPGAVAR